MFNEKEIISFLKTPLDVFCFESIDSTNAYAKQHFNENGKDFLVFANAQTAGRGRLGRSFYSPKNTGIYMTLALHSEKTAGDIVFVTTATAVAVCRAIEELTNAKPEIKWVNDIYLNERKICGILCEAVTGGVIIGTGLNVSTADFPKDIENAGSLNQDVNRAELTARIADEIITLFNSGGGFIKEYKRRSMILNKEIEYFENGTSHIATAVDIDSTGGLVVKDENSNIKTLRSGEISVRKMN